LKNAFEAFKADIEKLLGQLRRHKSVLVLEYQLFRASSLPTDSSNYHDREDLSDTHYEPSRHIIPHAPQKLTSTQAKQREFQGYKNKFIDLDQGAIYQYKEYSRKGGKKPTEPKQEEMFDQEI
jgi:hypothetical protein